MLEQYWSNETYERKKKDKRMIKDYKEKYRTWIKRNEERKKEKSWELKLEEKNKTRIIDEKGVPSINHILGMTIVFD